MSTKPLRECEESPKLHRRTAGWEHCRREGRPSNGRTSVPQQRRMPPLQVRMTAGAFRQRAGRICPKATGQPRHGGKSAPRKALSQRTSRKCTRSRVISVLKAPIGHPYETARYKQRSDLAFPKTSSSRHSLPRLQTLTTRDLVQKPPPSATNSEETGTDLPEVARANRHEGVILRPRNRYDQKTSQIVIFKVQLPKPSERLRRRISW